MKVVSDTGPIHYLVLVKAIDIMPSLFGTVSIPEAVLGELTHLETPAAVQDWCAPPPHWLAILPDPVSDDPSLSRLHAGERQAIRLAQTTSAELILMDDRAGVRAARAAGFSVVGTLGLVGMAHRRGLLEIESCIDLLWGTSFRCRPAMYDQLLNAARDWREASPR